MIEPHWTEVDGVTTIWTEAPAPLRAGLMFRTGRADETLVTAGQTHLIEHMTLATMADRFHNINGVVGDCFTGFFTFGDPADVSSFLLKVCETLKSLPGDRLEAEKQILAAESAARPYNVYANLATWRYGASGHGLSVMFELGIRGATLEQLRERSAQRFTSGNAVLWLSGPLPADLHLDLPPGVKQPLPALTPVPLALPGWFIDNNCSGVAAAYTVPRVSAASIFNVVAMRRLFERLRTQQAVSYLPMVYYEPLNADTAHLVLFAGSDQDRRAELAKAFGELVEGLSDINEAEVDTARKQLVDQLTGSLAPPIDDRIVNEVTRAAHDWLFWREYKSSELNAAEAASVSAAEMAAFVHDMRQVALYAIPGAAVVQPWMETKIPFSLAPVVVGRLSPSIDAPVKPERLGYGPDGVSLLFPDGSHITVRYAELAAAVHYPDGCVRLIGNDATTFTVEPTLWRNGASICKQIYERIPRQLMLEEASRSADAIPKPSTTAWQRFRASLNFVDDTPAGRRGRQKWRG